MILKRLGLVLLFGGVAVPASVAYDLNPNEVSILRARLVEELGGKVIDSDWGPIKIRQDGDFGPISVADDGWVCGRLKEVGDIVLIGHFDPAKGVKSFVFDSIARTAAERDKIINACAEHGIKLR